MRFIPPWRDSATSPMTNSYRRGSTGIDVAFVALPSGEAMKVVPLLKERVGKIIDLGGDFRLKSSALYEKYYRRPHTAPELLQAAVYGLPEINRERDGRGDACRQSGLLSDRGDSRPSPCSQARHH